eukprot:scaffold3830_cov108-Isochrysis_galbana.AAC.2
MRATAISYDVRQFTPGLGGRRRARGRALGDGHSPQAAAPPRRRRGQSGTAARTDTGRCSQTIGRPWSCTKKVDPVAQESAVRREPRMLPPGSARSLADKLAGSPVAAVARQVRGRTGTCGHTDKCQCEQMCRIVRSAHTVMSWVRPELGSWQRASACSCAGSQAHRRDVLAEWCTLYLAGFLITGDAELRPLALRVIRAAPKLGWSRRLGSGEPAPSWLCRVLPELREPILKIPELEEFSLGERRRLHILFLAALRAMPPSTECALAVRIVQLEYEMVPSATLFDPASSPLTGMPIRCAALQTLARCRPCVLD